MRSYNAVLVTIGSGIMTRIGSERIEVGLKPIAWTGTVLDSAPTSSVYHAIDVSV